jgi:hypothetical protein
VQQLRDYAAKFNNVDQMIKAAIEKERQCTTALEHTVAMLLQRIDSLE